MNKSTLKMVFMHSALLCALYRCRVHIFKPLQKWHDILKECWNRNFLTYNNNKKKNFPSRHVSVFHSSIFTFNIPVHQIKFKCSTWYKRKCCLCSVQFSLSNDTLCWSLSCSTNAYNRPATTSKTGWLYSLEYINPVLASILLHIAYLFSHFDPFASASFQLIFYVYTWIDWMWYETTTDCRLFETRIDKIREIKCNIRIVRCVPVSSVWVCVVVMWCDVIVCIILGRFAILEKLLVCAFSYVAKII